MAVICCELTAGSNNTNQAQNEGENPSRRTIEAMANTDDGGDDQCREINNQLCNRNAGSSVELHAGVKMQTVKACRVWKTD